MLTREQIEFLLSELAWESDVESPRERTQVKVMGYRKGIAGQCQAALSMMLEAKSRGSSR